METWTAPTRYSDVRPLTQGGMGELFVGTDSVSGNEVVIKLPRLDASIAADELTERFAREQQLLSVSSHPNIVNLVEVGEHAARLFIVTERVHGEDLRETLGESGRLSLERTVQIVDAVCQATAYLHESGILHRDLQPGNILLGADGSVRLTDFGIAVPSTQTSQITQTGQVIGTLDYMSPEQRHRLPVDERSDQFSIAAMAYEMLTGQRAVGVFRPPSEVNRDVPAEIDPVVMRALRNDPDERFASVDEFRQQFAGAITLAEASNRKKTVLRICGAIAVGCLALFSAFLASQGRDDSELKGGAEEHRSRRIDLGVSKEVTPQGLVRLDLSKAVSSVAEGDWKPGLESGEPPTLDSSNAAVSAETVKSLQKQWAEFLGIPVNVRSSTGMEFVLVPPGRFVMGSTEEDIAKITIDGEPITQSWLKKVINAQVPAHVVTITRPFYMARHETRICDFAAFIEDSEYETWPVRSGQGAHPIGRGRTKGINWKNNDWPQGDNDPVSAVAVMDCKEFCRWLGRKERLKCRLPTEAEWEFTCRSGTRTACYFGEGNADDYGWYLENTPTCEDTQQQKPLPVGTKLPNSLGVFDMYGNVWEYVADTYDARFYALSHNAVNPLFQFGNESVRRGGSWNTQRGLTRSALRNWRFQPDAYSAVGFRVLVEIPYELRTTVADGSREALLAPDLRQRVAP